MFLIGVAFAAGYWLAPSKVVKDTVVRIVERPDGSKETIIKEVERPQVVQKKDWVFAALVPINDLRFERDAIIISAQKRILGEIYAGPWVSLDGSFGLGVSLRF